MANQKSNGLTELRLDIFHGLKRAVFWRRGVPPTVKVPEPSRTKKADKPKTETSKRTKLSSSEDSGESSSGVSANDSTAESVQAKEESTQPENDEKAAAEGPEKLLELEELTQEVLYEATTVFPFTLFPDTVSLDREKLTIAERRFWRVANITSVPISEIMTVEANVGPFFGSVHLVFSFFTNNERDITFLWRHDAVQLQRMIHGFIIAHKKEINTTGVDLEDLKTILMDLGQGAAD